MFAQSFLCRDEAANSCSSGSDTRHQFGRSTVQLRPWALRQSAKSQDDIDLIRSPTCASTASANVWRCKSGARARVEITELG